MAAVRPGLLLLLLLLLALAIAIASAAAHRHLPQAQTAAATPTTLTKRAIPSFSAYNLLSRKGEAAAAGSGYNAVLSARPAPAEAAEFGSTYAFDMPLLAERSEEAELLGRVRGTYTFVDQAGGGVIFVSETFVIDNGGSLGEGGLNGTFSALGLEYIGLNSTKPIVGGTDDFVLASGVAITYPLPQSGVDAAGNLFFWFRYRFVFA
jgi:hypothetical protein